MATEVAFSQKLKLTATQEKIISNYLRDTVAREHSSKKNSCERKIGIKSFDFTVKYCYIIYEGNTYITIFHIDKIRRD